MFELAIARFGSVDIVVSGTSCALNVRLQFKKYPVQIPNAGIEESEEVCWGNLKFVDGKPAKPELLTLKVNMTGVIYSEQLPRRSYKDPPLDHLFGSRSPWDVLYEA